MGVNVKLGALPTLCTILPACPASSPPHSLKIEPMLGWLNLALLPSHPSVVSL